MFSFAKGQPIFTYGIYIYIQCLSSIENEIIRTNTEIMTKKINYCTLREKNVLMTR